MVGLQGEQLTGEEKSAIRECAFGGFVLFSRNLREPKQVLALCRSLWDQGMEHPPLIAIDQEGGRVHRLPQPFTHFPPAALVGRRQDPALAYRIGRATARELALVGINLDFAPVLDVDSNPKNPIIGVRSFGADPVVVSRLGSAFAKGLRDGGIVPCGKHFPGHGDTKKDSHVELPTVEKKLEALKSVELPPFIHSCRDRIESLMTAHVLYPSLDAKFPATLSRAIIGGLLRREIGYDGVVFSDDMEMKAISANYPLEDAAVLAVRAGVDVLLYCHDLANAVHAFRRLRRETERDAELNAAADQSYCRIKKLKRRRVKSFTGEREAELTQRLAQLKHGALVDEVQGSL